MNRLKLLLGVSILLVVSGQVDAAPVTFTFSGTVNSVSASSSSPILDGSVSAGQILSGQFTFDSTTPDLTLGNPEEGNYYPSGFLTASVGNYQLTAAPHIEIWNNRFGIDQYQVRTVGGGNEGVFTNGVDVFDSGNQIGEVFTWDMLLRDDDETVFSSTALPLTPPMLADFEIARFRIALSFGPGGGPLTIINSSVSELTVVPIPAAVWLFGTALIGLVGFSRRRKSA